jgi:hypothetical protein
MQATAVIESPTPSAQERRDHARVTDEHAVVEADLVLERNGDEEHRRHHGAGDEAKGQDNLAHRNPP